MKFDFSINLLSIAFMLLWIGTFFFVLVSIQPSSPVERLGIIHPNGSASVPDESESLVVSFRQLSELGETVGFSPILVGNSVLVSQSETVYDTPHNAGLRPLIREGAILRERDLHGEWIGSARESLFGFFFTETDDYGPFTVIEIWGAVHTEEGVYDSSRIGFYEILSDGRLRMIFRTRLIHGSDYLEEIHDVEYWELTQDSVFITLSRGELSVRMGRIEVPSR